MVIDSSPIRKKVRKDYQKVVRELESARQQLELFEKEDQPRFSQWVSRQFGALITQIREVGHKLQQQRELIYEIESEVYLTDCSFARAFERVTARRERGEPEPAKAEPETGETDTGGPDEFDRQFEDFFEEIRQAFEEGFSGGQAPPPHGRRMQAAEKEPPARLKDLYRALARRLHPDAQEQMTPQKKEWWHQAQAAYQAGDVEQLQVILSLCEIEEQGSTARTSVSLLMRIIRDFKSTLKTIRARVNQHRRDPAWGFSKLSDHQALAHQVERTLHAELSEMRRALEAVEAQLNAWSRQAQAAARRRKPSRRPARKQAEFWF